jgi:AcrR family transcriptional regulator
MVKKNISPTYNATAIRLLDVAEALFSEHGYAMTKVRDISAKSKVNQALINYHFKNKRGLFNAVFERRASILLQERIDLLNAAKLKAKKKPIPLKDVIYAFVYPPLRMASEDKGGRSFVKLQARLHNEPKEIENVLRAKLYDKVSLLFVEELKRTLPKLSEASICWRLIFVMGLYLYVASNTGRLEVISDGRAKGENLKQALPEILNFCEQGFLSPPTQP